MAVPLDRSGWLQGPQRPCEPAPRSGRRYGFVLLGPPGVGKGTQAALLSARLGPCHLSTGDIFRVAKGLPAEQRSPALNHAIDIISRGHLASDDIAVDLVRERAACLTCEGGFLLDGFPRSIEQAEQFNDILVEHGMALDTVLGYDLPLDQIVVRLGGRRMCPACYAIYHVEVQPPQTPGVCDRCGTALIQRDDDRPEAIAVRMKTYLAVTAPLVEHYAKRGQLVALPAHGTPEQVYQRTIASLEARGTIERQNVRD